MGEAPRIGFAVTLANAIVLAVMMNLALTGSVAALGQTRGLHEDEVALLAALGAVEQGDLDSGISGLERLTAHNPQFRLAHLLYADLLMARAGRAFGPGAAPAGLDSRLRGLRDEIAARVRHRDSPPQRGHVPSALLQLSPGQRRAIVVDISAARLYVFEQDLVGFNLVSDNYVSTGKRGAMKVREGDQRTPLGVYFVTTRLDSDALSDFYGAGALPINYPNEWDLRLGRTGYGIWVHGVPSDTYSRAPRASDGCMALPNVNMRALWEEAGRGQTPVVIADRIEWIPPRELARRRDRFLSVFEAWRSDWQSLDLERYARHYSAEFSADSYKRNAWLRHKRRVNALKTFISVRASDISVFAYPGEQGLVVVSFKQDYRSSNYSGSSRKRQYWHFEDDGEWRIVYEGSGKFRPIHQRGIPFSSRSGIALRNH